MTTLPPPGFHLPYPGFIHFGHFMPQVDINVLHHLASGMWARLNRPLQIVEVGSFTGASSLALAPYAERLICVDTWSGSKNDPEDRINDLYGDHGDGVMSAFMENVRHVYPVIQAARMTSAVAAGRLAAGKVKLDMVFLDGDHRYEAVKADIDAWLPLIRRGGILCGHDFGDLFPGVRRAVSETLGFGGCRIMGSIWWTTAD